MQPLSTTAPRTLPRRFAALKRVLTEAIGARAFPGCTFGALAGGEVVLEGALGQFTYEADARAVEPATLFDLASITKVACTTAAAMLLHQRGLLPLEMPLGELLPGFILGRPPGDPARRVALRHLLAHSSGLPGIAPLYRTARTPEELLSACLALPVEAEPGTRTEYSDPGFILLGKALEVIFESRHEAGRLDHWVHSHIFAPLGMNSTRFCPAPSAAPLIPPTEEDTTFRNRRIQGEVQDENAFVLGGVAGHAGLFSNVPDLLRLAGEMLAAARPASGKAKLFHAETIELFAQRQPPEGSSRALGWDTPSAPSSSGVHFSPHSIGHLGYSGGSLWIDLDAGISAVLLTNRTWPHRDEPTAELIRQVRPAFHNALREAL